MNPKTMTKIIVLKRLVESIDEKRVEQNLPALDKVADKITDDIGTFLLPLLTQMVGDQSNDGDSIAPKQCHVKGLG